MTNEEDKTNEKMWKKLKNKIETVMNKEREKDELQKMKRLIGGTMKKEIKGEQKKSQMIEKEIERGKNR